MSNPLSPPPRDHNARRKAQNHFEAAEARTSLVKQMVAAENAMLDARTAKLRALRLAKEAEDAAAAPTAKPKSKRAKKA
ncbi:MAG: hypothetical protein JSR60_20265 [Proteobacteria bacterium]|nr:hypothetical protein [Pseudomonadota bacterium]